MKISIPIAVVAFSVLPSIAVVAADDTFPNSDSVPVELLGVYTGDEKYPDPETMVNFPFCGNLIVQPPESPNSKYMQWNYNDGTCESAGFDQVTGTFSSNWFGQVDLAEIYYQKILGWECLDASYCPSVVDYPEDSSGARRFDDYEVVATSCGRVYVQDLNRADNYCATFQTNLLQKKDKGSKRALRSSDDNEHVRRTTSSTTTRSAHGKRGPVARNLSGGKGKKAKEPDQLVVATWNYGLAITDGTLPPLDGSTCPSTTFFDLPSLFEESSGVKGIGQFVLQQGFDESSYDPCSWSCYTDKDTKCSGD